MNVVVIVVVVVVLAGVLLFAMARRQDRQEAIGALSRETRRKDRSGDPLAPSRTSAAPATGRAVERAAALERREGGRAVVVAPAAVPVPASLPPLDEEAIGVTRRQFLNRGILGLTGLSVAGFGAACIGFLWPSLSGGFGAKINAGKFDDILGQARDKKTPYYVPSAHAYVNPYPPEDASKAKAAGYSDPVVAGMQLGVVALYQKCVHLGCRVPWCDSSQWFECPCHGSKYNRVGEKKGGPAPRGLDRFAPSVVNGNLVIDTGTIFLGPPIGTNTTGQEAEGPHCH